MALVHLDDSNFADAIASGVTIVDFWASWCGPCRMFGPTFEAASNKHAGVKFAKFELDEKNRRTAAKYGIRSIPTIMAFQDGEVKESITGLMDPDDFDRWVNSVNS